MSVLNEEQLNHFIDNTVNNTSHYDLAYIFYNIFKDKYRYIGKQRWDVYDYNNKEWKKDLYKFNLKNDIRLTMADYYLKRSIYWYKTSIDNKEMDIIYKMRGEKLLRIRNNLKNDKYISILIKEASAFFDYNPSK